MTGRAVLIAWIGHVMGRRLDRDAFSLRAEVPPAVVTFQAQGKHDRAQEQSRISRPMRSVAGLAAIDADAKMFEDEGPALIGMAIKARLFVWPRLLYVSRARGHPPSGSKGSVRIVAVGAGDHSFFHSVLEGHRELSAHVGMAPFAERGLGLAQERAHGLRPVNRMATGACHPV